MRLTRNLSPLAVIVLAGFGTPARPADPKQEVKETVVAGPNQVALKVRMEGPYTADVPLQVVCYFKYTPAGAKRMFDAPVELDRRLGGVIASLRERGEFAGNELETVLITPPKGSIRAKALLLIGLGDEGRLSLDTMERVGKVGLREAVRLGAARVAFAPLVRDQGNSVFKTGDVETAVVRGMLLAYDTERRLQKEGLAKAYTLEEWWVEAGPAYYDETVAGVKKASAEAAGLIKARESKPYTSGKR
jgi:hypothetical protein